MLLNSTVELMTLWASASPSLLAFFLSHAIIAVLLLGGRGCAPGVVNGGTGERITGGSEAETPPDAAEMRRSKRNRGGEDEPVTVSATAIAIGGCSCALEVHDRAEESCVEAGEVDAASLQTQAREKSSGGDDMPAAAAAANTSSSSREKCTDEEEDELMTRAEEFIRRMNRVWMTENVRVC